MFSDGVTKINKTTPSGQAGSLGGTFVMPKSVADRIIQEAKELQEQKDGNSIYNYMIKNLSDRI